jgi:hypothetical protein
VPSAVAIDQEVTVAAPVDWSVEVFSKSVQLA